MRKLTVPRQTATTRVWLQPLLNVTLEPRSFTARPGLRLRRPTNAEIDRWTKNERLGTALPLAYCPEHGCVLEVSATNSIVRLAQDDRTQEDAFSLMALIGLGSRDPLWTPFCEEQFHQGNKHDYTIAEISGTYRPSDRVNGIGVTKRFIRGLRKAWPKVVNESKHHRKVRLSLGRWARASNPQLFSEDRLMDAWVGLEALFTENESELSLKAAIRIAQFLKKDYKRSNLIMAMRSAYAVRSRVAHGEMIRESDELHINANRSSEILRMALLRLLFKNIDIAKFQPKQLEDDFISSV